MLIKIYLHLFGHILHLLEKKRKLDSNSLIFALNNN